MVDFIGENAQIDKTIEEILELAEVIMKVKTKDIIDLQHIMQEIAHVYMVLRSLKIVFKIRDKDIAKEIKHKENLLMAKYPGVLE